MALRLDTLGLISFVPPHLYSTSLLRAMGKSKRAEKDKESKKEASKVKKGSVKSKKKSKKVSSSESSSESSSGIPEADLQLCQTVAAAFGLTLA